MQRSANSVEKMQVFCPWSSLRDVGLDGAAHVSQHPSADLGGLRVVWLAAVLLGECPHPLVDDGVKEHRQDGRRGR